MKIEVGAGITDWKLCVFRNGELGKPFSGDVPKADMERDDIENVLHLTYNHDDKTATVEVL